MRQCTVCQILGRILLSRYVNYHILIIASFKAIYFVISFWQSNFEKYLWWQQGNFGRPEAFLVVRNDQKFCTVNTANNTCRWNIFRRSIPILLRHLHFHKDISFLILYLSYPSHTKVSFFHQCSKMQIIPIKKFNIHLVFSNFFGFSD